MWSRTRQYLYPGLWSIWNFSYHDDLIHLSSLSYMRWYSNATLRANVDLSLRMWSPNFILAEKVGALILFHTTEPNNSVDRNRKSDLNVKLKFCLRKSTLLTKKWRPAGISVKYEPFLLRKQHRSKILLQHTFEARRKSPYITRNHHWRKKVNHGSNVLLQYGRSMHGSTAFGNIINEQFIEF